MRDIIFIEKDIIGDQKKMIKLIIFDLDCVLVDAKELHYKALNEALKNVDKKYIGKTPCIIQIYWN